MSQKNKKKEKRPDKNDLSKIVIIVCFVLLTLDRNFIIGNNHVEITQEVSNKSKQLNIMEENISNNKSINAFNV